MLYERKDGAGGNVQPFNDVGLIEIPEPSINVTYWEEPYGYSPYIHLKVEVENEDTAYKARVINKQGNTWQNGFNLGEFTNLGRFAFVNKNVYHFAN